MIGLLTIPMISLLSTVTIGGTNIKKGKKERKNVKMKTKEREEDVMKRRKKRKSNEKLVVHHVSRKKNEAKNHENSKCVMNVYRVHQDEDQ